ncbi:N-acetylmuramoyl-L-alanine amidase [Alkalihalophilus lindianensis]|uniref:N-acetylmuramoyl-L-alanine amidase n=1 Tax=Alkalihalophilus lindianensis TaxID=1630542 RepID=A0ABU3X834_9BACI|nr:N-acetylmuramoyl-L-alanine amidase [Alkalihalophilus lindianensis]MDV2683792.1 N-acetylmuramoyl-L-alanine amidase [Alkalihalophilus lindianensis]MDV2683858.1 N-acetylmuramoyl-L-alanine amidase [Alkalihalophilus lindianensis]
MRKIKIFIDPGHGGTDPGAVAHGLREKDLVLTIALALKRYLEQFENVEIMLSREDDRFLTLSQRTQMANAWGADIFISVHINAGGGAGFETFIFNSSVSTATISNQHIIHAEIMKAIGGNDRGKKRANFAVLRTSNMPAILTEAAFIDNAIDAVKLKDPRFIESVVRGHGEGIVKVFNLKPKQVNSSVANQTKSQEDKEEEYFNMKLTQVELSAVISALEDWTDETKHSHPLDKEWLEKARKGELTIRNAVRLQYEARRRGIR